MTDILISPTLMDLGKIEGTSPKSFWFDVANTTEKDILATPWASCGCTTPQLLPSIIPSGGYSKLKVEFDPTDKSGVQEKNVGIKYEKEGKPFSISVTFRVII